MKKHFFCLFLIGVALGGVLFAQSNALIDKLLDEKQATYGETAFLTLSAAGLIKPEAAVADAMSYLQTSGWGYVKKADKQATLGDLCYLLMRAYNLTGGIMYTLFPGPRYATREFEYQRWVRRAPIPTRPVSGEEVMQIVGLVLNARGEVAK